MSGGPPPHDESGLRQYDGEPDGPQDDQPGQPQDDPRHEAAAERAARRQGLAVGLSTGLYGVSFGALSSAAGMPLWATMVLSLVLFSGGSQFAFVGVVGAGGGFPVAVATSTLLGLRNGLYALQVARWVRTSGARRVAAAQLTIDESTAVGLAQPTDQARRVGFWVTGVTIYVCWNLMTLVGALLGDAMGDPQQYGLDAMAVGAFVALLWPRLSSAEPRAVAVLSAFVAVLCLPVLPAGLPVLAAAVVAVAAAVRSGRRAGTS